MTETTSDNEPATHGIRDEILDLAVPVRTLHQFHGNPRVHADEVIKGSLRVNGQYRPVVVNRGTYTKRPDEVLAGNGTLAAVRDLGWDLIAATWVDVDDDAATRIVAVDNRANDLAAYDDRLLAEMLGGLEDLSGTGFDEMDLDALRASLPELDDLVADTDDRSGDGSADRDLWPTLRLSLPSGVIARWKAVVEESGGDEAETFAKLVGYEGSWS